MSEDTRHSDGSEQAPTAADGGRLEDVALPTEEEQVVARIMEHTIDLPVLASAVDRQEAADAADVLEQLEDDEAVELLEQMDDQNAALALAEMQKPLAGGVLQDLIADDIHYAARLLVIMAADDAADLLQTLDHADRLGVLEHMPTETASALQGLIRYDEESAGGLMTTDYLSLVDTFTVGEATEFIRTNTVPERTQFLPVTSREDVLVGMIGLRELLLARADEPIAEHMISSVKVVHPDVDREQLAQEFDRYDWSMIPVVDNQDRLLGIVTVDDVIDIIREEQTEDVQKTVGAGAGEAVYSTLPDKLRGRFPWMAASLVMTCCAALVIIGFERLVQEHTILAFLLPVIAALVGNAGHQALAVTLRGIVLDEVRRERVLPLVGREASVGAAMGATLGLGILGVVVLVQGMEHWRIGCVAGLATFVAMGVGTLAGSSIPLIMRRLGADPAQSSAIFLIMITDGVSFTVLLAMTSALL